MASTKPNSHDKGDLVFNIPSLLKQNYMQASFSEVLRQRVHIILTRYPDRGDIQLPQYSIPAKSHVMICSSIPHLDETIWNTGRHGEHSLDAFWPERFLSCPGDPFSGPVKPEHSFNTTEASGVRQHVRARFMGQKDGFTLPVSQPECPSNPSNVRYTKTGLEGIWMPFGGGSQMCPGQHFAKAEIFLCTAILVTCFDIELHNPNAMIGTNQTHFGTGVSKPAASIPFRIRRRRSQPDSKSDMEVVNNPGN